MGNNVNVDTFLRFAFGIILCGLNEKITEDCLLFYLEKYSGVEVKEVIIGCNNNAVAIFEAEPGTTNVTC